MGNRGCLHNDMRQVISNSKRDAWVTCLLSFSNRTRQIMTPGNYTELFFLDEATALAAGHRPCAECRRERYNEFRAAWSKGNERAGKISASDVDKKLKADRITRDIVSVLSSLPTGTIVKHEDSREFFLIRHGKMHKWSFDGYGPGSPLSSAVGPFRLITPVSTVNAIRSGYAVEMHVTAK
jgi:hypothetical protein